MRLDEQIWLRCSKLTVDDCLGYLNCTECISQNIRVKWRDQIGLPVINWQVQGWSFQLQLFKILEELGEVSRAFVRLDQYPDEWEDIENVAKEIFDIMETCITLLSMMEKEGINIDKVYIEHHVKLAEKGLISPLKQVYIKENGK